MNPILFQKTAGNGRSPAAGPCGFCRLRIATVQDASWSALLSAQSFNFRNILDVSYVGYSNDNYVFETENTLLYYWSDTIIPLAKVRVTKTQYELRTLVQPGLVWIFMPGVYAEMVYGLSTNEDGELGQDGYIEVFHETDTTIASARLRGGYYHESEVVYFIPDVSLKKQFTPLYSLKAKYFFGYTDEPFYSHSLQLENGFTFYKNYTATVITTGITEEIRDSWENSWSAGLRLEALFADRLTLKYLFQFHKRPSDIWGIENGLTFDWEF